VQLHEEIHRFERTDTKERVSQKRVCNEFHLFLFHFDRQKQFWTKTNGDDVSAIVLAPGFKLKNMALALNIL